MQVRLQILAGYFPKALLGCPGSCSWNNHCSGGTEKGNQEFHFGHIKFELPSG
jgi:hypothetical protein